jgi:hypothetical protein
VELCHARAMEAVVVASLDGDPAPLLRILAHNAEIVGQRVLDRVQLQRIDCWLWRDSPIRKDELTSRPVRVCTVKSGEYGPAAPSNSGRLSWAASQGQRTRPTPPNAYEMSMVSMAPNPPSGTQC